MPPTCPATAQHSRTTHLPLPFPLWLFDPDQPAWPRKRAAVPPGSRPAKLTGWYTWPWEYGTGVRRIDDALPPGVTGPAPQTGQPGPGSMQQVQQVQQVLSQLRYDDRFEPGTFRVVYEAGGAGGAAGEGVRDLEEWVWEVGVEEGYVAPRRVVRVERRWDGVPVWERGRMGVDVLGGGGGQGKGEGACVVYGVASLVGGDEELVRAAGVDSLDGGEKIRRAQIEFLDEEGGQARGIVYPGKNQSERGLYITRGPEFAWNKRLLAGTALEGAPWSDVENYVRQKRNYPLI